MPDLLQNLNTEQLNAVTHSIGPLLIVAGAGTGKTTVITRRLAYLIEQKLAKPDEILALTFTEKAAGEMGERVDLLLPLGSYDLWISTFHSFCERILKQHALDIGLANNFKLLDEVQQWILVYKNFDKFKLDYYRPVGSPNKFIEALVRHFSKCKDEMITPEQYMEYAEKQKLSLDSPEVAVGEQATEIKRLEEIAGAYHVYQKLLLDNEYLDFGDLINYTMRLFAERPNILKFYQEKFKFLMVDEFQDTNFAQYQLVKMLAGTQQNLVVVGDDDQSIYKFRGASVSNILKLKQDFPQVKEITLVENYRSNQNILDLSYNFIQANNPNRLEPQLGINKKLKSNVKDKGEIVVLEGKDLSEELDSVVKKIIELKNSNTKATWNDFAILIRANAAAEEIMPRLEAAEITFSFVANRGLYRKKLIFDLISYLKLLDNFHDSAALYRLIQFPKFSINTHDLATITQASHKKTLSLYESLAQVRSLPGLSEKTCKQAESLVQLLHQHSDLAKTKTAVEMFVTVIGDLGVAQMLEADTLANAQDRDLLDQFFKRIELFEEQNEDKSLRSFLATLNLEILAGSEGPIKFDPELGPESLKILTIHSAKGLEFKYVFIINMVDQRFPTRAHSDAIALPEPLIKDILPEGDFHLQEERRLFYVAMTRAKTHLYLSWARDYGGSRARKPSLFLQETKLVPSEKVSKATGKVVFNRKPGAKKSIVYKQLPTEFSFTEISSFKNCPLEYKYRFYLRLPMPGNANLSFGRTIHKTLQLFAEIYQSQNAQVDLFGGMPKGTFASRKNLEKIYEDNWIDEWYPDKANKEKYRQLGKQIIKTFYDDLEANKPNIKYIESSFTLPLGDYKFVGRVDRADETENGLAIIDYKTGSAPKNKTTGSDLDQLRVYQWAAQDQWKEKIDHLAYWYLRDNQRVAVSVASEADIAKLQTELLKTAEEIRQAIKYDLFADLHAKTRQHTCNFGDLL